MKDRFLDNLNEHTAKIYDFHWKKYLASNPPKTVQANAKRITEHIENYLYDMRVAQKLGYQSRNLAYSAIRRHYSVVDDIILNWDRIREGVQGGVAETEKYDLRAYTKEEIRTILEIADLQERAIILLASCTGMRRLAILNIRLKDMELVEDEIYKIEVYKFSPEEYYCFTTPEATRMIKRYIKYEKPTDLLFPNIETGEAMTSKMRRLCLRVKIGSPQADHQYVRSDVPALHGFRKFCITQMTTAKISEENQKFLTGHSVGVRKRYVETKDKGIENMLLEEYKNAIPLLTIDRSQQPVIYQKSSDSKDQEIAELKAQMKEMDANNKLLISSLLNDLSKKLGIDLTEKLK